VPTPSGSDVTRLLLAWRAGDDGALARLVPLVHAELRRLAHQRMRGERPDRTLQTTALVNEAYIRLVGAQDVSWQNRAHFLAVCDRLVAACLAKDREERLQSAHDVMQQLQWTAASWAAPDGTAAAQPALPRLARARWLVVGVVVGLAAAGGVASLYFRSGDRPTGQALGVPARRRHPHEAAIESSYDDRIVGGPRGTNRSPCLPDPPDRHSRPPGQGHLPQLVADPETHPLAVEYAATCAAPQSGDRVRVTVKSTKSLAAHACGSRWLTSPLAR
jgi:hypothetical protein